MIIQRNDYFWSSGLNKMLLRGGDSTGSNACSEHAVSTVAGEQSHTHTFHLFPFTMNITTKKI